MGKWIRRREGGWLGSEGRGGGGDQSGGSGGGGERADDVECLPIVLMAGAMFVMKYNFFFYGL